MPQIGNLVLTDRKTTPVAHTFTPAGEDANGVWSVRESSGTPITDRTASLSLKKTPTRYKPELRFSFPVGAEETINGVTRQIVLRTARARIEFDFDAASTEAERKDVVGMVQSALDDSKALTNDMIVKLEHVY